MSTAAPHATLNEERVRIATQNHGVSMPIVGFGVYQIPPEDRCAVADAVRVGYRHLDTAAAYRN